MIYAINIIFSFCRSVLFKYMNPNMALVMTEGVDTQSKTMLTVQMVDLVTGKIFFSATHKKVSRPFHGVHSENWAAEAGCDGLVIIGDTDGGAVVLRHLLAADHHHVEQEQLLVSIILGR